MTRVSTLTPAATTHQDLDFVVYKILERAFDLVHGFCQLVILAGLFVSFLRAERAKFTGPQHGNRLAQSTVLALSTGIKVKVARNNTDSATDPMVARRLSA